MFRLTPVVKNLLIINIVVFLLPSLLNAELSGLFGLHYVGSERFLAFQFVTYMFLHGGWGHLFSNMFALFIFGPMLEKFWGNKKFFLYYMVTGIGAGILYSGIYFWEMKALEADVMAYVEAPSPEDYNRFIYDHYQFAYNSESQFIDQFDQNPNNESFLEESKSRVLALYRRSANIPMVGASGAIFGILIAFGLYFPNLQLFLLFPPIPIKAKYLVTFYALYELYGGIQQVPGDNVAHWAHVGGMLIGFLVIKFWFKDRTGVY